MELQATEIDIGTHTPTVILHTDDAAALGVHPLDRVEIEHEGGTDVTIVETTDELVDPGTVAVTDAVGQLDGRVSVTIAPKPGSAAHIRKKLDDTELEAHEIDAIVSDIDQDRLSDVELSSFVTAIYTNGLSRAEITALTRSMVDVGETLTWDTPVVADKHSIGGVAGNRVTPIVIPIVAAAGETIPKTSSRAVTSAAGTADVMEVFCDVSLSLSEMRSVVEQTGGCLIWGGSVRLSPVDDQIIRVETPLSLDPPGQAIASVLSKKKSAGSTRVVIDIPYGEGAKVAGLDAARQLAEDFERVGSALDMRVRCAITHGRGPIGDGIGCGLEARDVLRVLAGKGPSDLRLKSLRIANILLSACDNPADAKEILDSGRALERFRDIIAAQNGDPDVAPDDLPVGAETTTITAARDGVVSQANNRLVNETARRAGAPKDAGAGLELSVSLGDSVEAGDDLFTIHARTASKLHEAEDFTSENEPVRVRPSDEALVEEYP